jgi:rod shape-determining protein MreC
MRKKWFLWAGILFFLFVALFLLKTDPFKGIAGIFLQPFWRAESYLAQELRDFFSKYLILIDVKRENQALKEQVLILKQELAYYQERENLYQRLEKLFKISEGLKHPQVVARIVYKAIDPYLDQIIIEKGSKDGLMPQMPVLSLVGNEGVGLVGQVVEVHRSWSRVILITDPSFSADVKVLRTQERGILKGKGEPYITLEFLPLYSQAKERDILVTSGQDLLFPPGLLVGEMVSVNKDVQGLFKRAEVRPSVDIYNLSWVVVLLKVPEIPI